ncbi:MAG: HAD-IB family hydrolase [bacterium]|nr:HAD-IB family hydrolase [bacterium]
MRKVAIFDIDGTIFRGSLLIELVEVLIERDIFKVEARRIYQAQKLRWLDRQGDYEAYINAVVAAFMKNLKGVFYGDFKDAADTVVARYQDRTYRYTRDLVSELRRKGYYLLAVSHSPKGIVDIFGKRLGFNKIYGMIYDLGPTDRFTGTITDPHLIQNKGNILRRAVEKEKLTLKGSIGVGDTESDVSFLELVEKPICFNPNEKLYKYGKRNKWKIVVERKNVIYEI